VSSAVCRSSPVAEMVLFGKAFELSLSISSERVSGEVIEIKVARIALIVVGLITLVMGVMGATTVMYGVADPMWHAVFKIVVGLIAVGIGLVEKS
jgi:hypothetical protein